MDHYATNNALSPILNTGQLICEGKDVLNIACSNYRDEKILSDTVMDDACEPESVAKDNEVYLGLFKIA